MDIIDLFHKMAELDASDLFLRINSPPKMRIYSEVVDVGDKKITKDEMYELVNQITNEEKRKTLFEQKGVDFAIYIQNLGRFRVSLFIQRNTPALVVRRVKEEIFNFEELNLPSEVLKKLCKEKRGLILVTGATGSGKSTTIASMINYINSFRKCHILTLEEPIEFIFKDDQAIINQREIGLDVKDYKSALRQFALQSPDVIYIANIRDTETMSAALTAAETGVLVFSTLHTINAYQTVQRIINFFPPYQHNQVLLQLSLLLKGVISLRLIKRADTQGMIPAYEIMTLSPTISRLLREAKIWEIPRYIEEGDIYGMISFKKCLIRLVREGKITPQSALEYADSKEDMRIELKNILNIDVER